MTLHVRPMTLHDIDAVYAIEKVAHVAPWGRDILFDCVCVAYDCRVLELRDEKATQIVGYVISRYDGPVCHVLNLCIATAFQAQGYGRYLLQQVIDAPTLSGINAVSLEVRPSNQHALRLYQTMGFVQIGIKPDYYRDQQGIEDGLVLQYEKK